jgi:DNA-binding GntR family transcriptional regulator
MDDGYQLNLKTLKEQVYDYLSNQLSRQELRPGDAINLDAVCHRLGVSKTPLRDALIVLETEGFVRFLPRRGVYVTALTLQDIRDIYQIIGALESGAVLGGRGRFRPEHAEAMAGLNAGMKAALDSDDFAGFYRLNLAFHDTYIELAGNAALHRIVHTLKKRLYDFPKRDQLLKEWEYASVDEHQRITELLTAGDHDDAATFVRDVHWSFPVQERFIRIYYAGID